MSALHIQKVSSDEEIKLLRNPFAAPSASSIKPHYSIAIPEDCTSVLLAIVDELENIKAMVKVFELNNSFVIKIKFNHPIWFEEDSVMLLPILQKYNLSEIMEINGDVITYDNKGDIVGWLSQEFLTGED